MNRKPVEPFEVGWYMAFPIKIEDKPTEGNLDLLELPNTWLVYSIRKGVAVVESAGNHGICQKDSWVSIKVSADPP